MSKLVEIGTFIRVWSLRVLPVLGFAVLGGLLSIQIDRFIIDQKRGEEFLNYTSFVASNAREGENVNFTLCREHEQNFNVTGNLNIYVVRAEDGKPYQVFARDVKDQVANECDNKEILASDFHHEPGTYEIRFCVDFRVKYNIQKTVCKSSNRYKIYEQPTDIQAQIKRTEELLAQLRSRETNSVERRDTPVNSPNVSSNTPSQPTTPTQNQPAQEDEVATETPPAPALCLIDTDVLGLIPIKIACESR